MNEREIIEALIFTSDGSRLTRDIKQVLPDLSDKEIEEHVADLNRIYQETGRSFRIEPAANGYLFVSRNEYTPYLKRLSPTMRLSQAALEVLAVVAYRGPCTKPEIETIRGVDSTSAIKNLLKAELIDIKAGKPLRYITTARFLEVFGLRSLSELPDIKQFEEALSMQERTENEETEEN